MHVESVNKQIINVINQIKSRMILSLLPSWVQVEGCFLPRPPTLPTSPPRVAAMQAAAATPPPLPTCPLAAPSSPLPSPPPPTPCPHWQARYCIHRFPNQLVARAASGLHLGTPLSLLICVVLLSPPAHPLLCLAALWASVVALQWLPSLLSTDPSGSS